MACPLRPFHGLHSLALSVMDTGLPPWHVVLEELIPCWPLLATGRAVSLRPLWPQYSGLAVNPRKGLPRPRDQSGQGPS